MRTKSLAILAVTLMLTAGGWAASSEKVLFDFTVGSDGAYPTSGLVFDTKGNLYGTTENGGANFYGTVFQLTHSKSGWTENVLYSFTNGSDGAYPSGALVFDKAGNLYGTAVSGGSTSCSNGCGTVFELVPGSGGSWTFSVIYSFTGGKDGFAPAYGSLILDKAGNLYGTAEMGGKGAGTVFELIHSKGGWKEKTLYQFAGGSDAGFPLAGLSWDAASNLYGATVRGGTSNAGAVFQLKHIKAGWKEKVIYSFTGGNDGAYPEYGGVTLNAAGDVYGAVAGGGASGQGVVFELKPSKSGWKESVLYSFTGGSDGGQPFAGLTFNPAGNLFGATAYGANGDGTVFELAHTKSGWKESTLHIFAVSDGAFPYGSVVLDGKGRLYGTTFRGGSGSAGVVFEVTP
jgi:uncharacterized repeat protein (TIGR03803 family)